jgi:hypothetical protein
MVGYHSFRGSWYLNLQCEGGGWRQHGPLKRWYPTTTLHDVTTQKTSIYILNFLRHTVSLYFYLRL